MTDDDGQDYAFHVALSDQAESLTRTMRAADPSAFLYKGWDLERAFALYVMYAGTQDPALYSWFEKSRGHAVVPPPFAQDLGHLLAQHWFGRRIPPLSLKLRLRRLLRYQKCWLGNPRRRPRRPEGNLPERCDILFLAQVKRFARFLDPLPAKFSGRHAWMVPAEPWSEDLQEELFQSGKPFLTLAGLKPSLAPMGRALAHLTPELALQADSLETALRRLRPSVVVIPEGNHPLDEITNRVSKHLGIPVLCIQQGWSPLIHAGFRNLDYASMAVWGQGFAELLRPLNPHQSFAATGNHKLDVPRNAADLPSGILFLCQGHDKWIGYSGERLHLDLAAKLAAADPNLPIYIRPHPVVPLTDFQLGSLAQFPNIYVEQASYISLSAAFAKVNISVSICSSAILESAAAGVIPIVFNMTSMPRYHPDIEAAGAGIQVSGLNDAFIAIMSLLADKPRRAAMAARLPGFSHKYFADYGDYAAENIVAEIKRLSRR